MNFTLLFKEILGKFRIFAFEEILGNFKKRGLVVQNLVYIGKEKSNEKTKTNLTGQNIRVDVSDVKLRGK